MLQSILILGGIFFSVFGVFLLSEDNIPASEEIANIDEALITDERIIEENIEKETAPETEDNAPEIITPEPEPTQRQVGVDVVETAPISQLDPISVQKLEWGTYVGYTREDLENFEEMVGGEVDIRAIFVNWYTPFPTTFGDLRDSNKTLLIFWEHHGVSVESIASGEHDEYIREFRDAAIRYGGRIMLSPFHEMNGNWDPWGGTVGDNTPEQIVLAWQRIFDIFSVATNVEFAWTVNNVSVPDVPENQISQYYPGDEYVDYVAVDGFNFGRPWRTFSQVFDEVLDELKSYGKPIYIVSTATAEGGRKAAWIVDAFGEQIYKHPEVIGWVWFNIDKERDWRVESDPASLEAFKSIIP